MWHPPEANLHADGKGQLTLPNTHSPNALPISPSPTAMTELPFYSDNITPLISCTRPTAIFQKEFPYPGNPGEGRVRVFLPISKLFYLLTVNNYIARYFLLPPNPPA